MVGALPTIHVLGMRIPSASIRGAAIACRIGKGRPAGGTTLRIGLVGGRVGAWAGRIGLGVGSGRPTVKLNGSCLMRNGGLGSATRIWPN